MQYKISDMQMYPSRVQGSMEQVQRSNSGRGV